MQMICNANSLHLLKGGINRMKRLGYIALIAAGALTVGCGSNTSDNQGANNTTKSASVETMQASTDEEKLKVYTSFYPLYDFAVKVGGDKVEVINMVPTGEEPHHYEPLAKEVAALETADVFIYNGAGLESWADKVIAGLETKELLVVEASSGLEILEGHNHSHDHEESEVYTHEDGEEEGHTHEHEEEAHEHEEGEVHEHEEAENHEHEEGHHHGGLDPHVWLSIKDAKYEMNNIKEAFITADPENEAYYEANYEKYAKEFDALDQKFEETLSEFEKRDIVVAHQAFSYLCKDYNLNQVAIEGLSAESEPDPARMAEIVEFARENDIKVIFFEELVSPKVAETIADEIGATTMVLNPLEGLTKEQLDAGEDYLSIMGQNLEALQEALSR